jgi:hypothetical protein
LATELASEVKEHIRALAMYEMYWSRRAPTIVPRQMDLYKFAAEIIGSSAPVLYLEFGVADGHSMGRIVELFTNPTARFVGFDSFEGLPEDWLMHKKGAFGRKGQPPDINDGRLTFVKGWFQNSVPDFFRQYSVPIGSTVLVHFDADLYSSTLFLLATLWAQINKYYYLMDEFIYDEVVALHDFSSAFPVRNEFLAQTTGGGNPPNPDQVLGFMERVAFKLESSAK